MGRERWQIPGRRRAVPSVPLGVRWRGQDLRESRRWQFQARPRRRGGEALGHGRPVVVPEAAPEPSLLPAKGKPRWRIKERRTVEQRLFGRVSMRRRRSMARLRRLQSVEGMSVGLGFGGLGVSFLVAVLLSALRVPESRDVGGLVGLACLASGGLMFVTLGMQIGWSAVRKLRAPETRVGLDERHLWWEVRGLGATAPRPDRVVRSEIVKVGLRPGGGAVVVRTGDGVAHRVTDMGTLSERVALAAAIGAAVVPGENRVAPDVPPPLPAGWAHRLDGRTSTMWRRPAGIGWRVGAGRLDALTDVTRTGEPTMSTGRRRVVALGLDRHPRTGRVRLHALLDDEERVTVMAGRRTRRKVVRFARWLADRTGVPLFEEDAR